MGTELSLCMGCMQPLENSSTACPCCGYIPQQHQDGDTLPPGTKIGPYLLGQKLSQNGESIRYLGYDTQRNRKVWVKEFYPSALVKRDAKTFDLEVIPGCETRFKYFKASFEDLNKTLQSVTGVECVPEIWDILEYHNTFYVFFQFLQAKSLETVLQENGSEFLWCKAKLFLLPLLNGVSNLHKKGIFHQGICPENILLDQENRPYLTGFSIPEVRTDQGELTTQLYPGFSAPEQYNLQSWQGTWTDVYSLGAVTYYLLTGCRPPQAVSRLEQDTLEPPAKKNFLIAENISDAILKAMEPRVERRFQGIDEFTGKLLETVSSNTAVFQVESDQNPTTIHLEPASRRRVRARYTFVTMVITLVVLAAAGSYLYQDLAPPPPSAQVNTEGESAREEQKEQTRLPSFIGRTAEEVLQDSVYFNHLYFTVEESYSETVEKGKVIEQRPSPGTVLGDHSSVTLVVSKGSGVMTMPDLYGASLSYAQQTVAGMNLSYRVYEVENSEVEPGQVFRTHPSAGTELKKDSKGQVLLYVAKSPAPQKEEGQDSGKGIIRRKEPVRKSEEE